MIINLLFRIWILYSVQYFLSEKKRQRNDLFFKETIPNIKWQNLIIVYNNADWRLLTGFSNLCW